MSCNNSHEPAYVCTRYAVIIVRSLDWRVWADFNIVSQTVRHSILYRHIAVQLLACRINYARIIQYYIGYYNT